MAAGAACTCKSYAPCRHFQAASDTGTAFAPAAPSPELGDVAVITCLPFPCDLLSGRLQTRGRPLPAKNCKSVRMISEIREPPGKSGRQKIYPIAGRFH